MSKIFKKIIAGTSIAFCLGGVAATTMPTVEASASNYNYHTDYDNLRMQTIFTEGDKATIVVNASESALQSGGVTLECKDSNYNCVSFTSLTYAGTLNFDNGNSVSSVYNYDTGKYEVTFTIYRNTISTGARGYFYVYGNYSGIIMDENGGYGYQLW